MVRKEQNTFELTAEKNVMKLLNHSKRLCISINHSCIISYIINWSVDYMSKPRNDKIFSCSEKPNI